MLKPLRRLLFTVSVHGWIWPACLLATLWFPVLPVHAQHEPVRVIAFGAHPDDCDLGAGGLAAKYAALGYKVKFVSLTNGDAGHQSEGGGQLAMRRRAEAQEAARRIGMEYEVLDNHDGRLLPTLEVREQIIREIRQWKADIVIGPRPNDYHPDHRYTGVLVQDASYMVIVPNIVTDTPALRRNPVFLYYSDRFTRPQPFRADIVVSIDDVYQKKIEMLDAHVSQFYEWLPWTAGQLDDVPKDPVARKTWLATRPIAVSKVRPEWRDALEKRYGAEAPRVQHAEAFEITEYGRQPSEEEIRMLFPFFPHEVARARTARTPADATPDMLLLVLCPGNNFAKSHAVKPTASTTRLSAHWLRIYGTAH